MSYLKIHHLFKISRVNNPGPEDTALPPASRAYGPEGEMGRGLAMKELSSFTSMNVESLFHEQSLTIPPAQQVGFETTKIGSLTLGEDRSLARLWWQGNPPEEDERRRTCPCEIRDDAMIVKGYPKFIDKRWRWKYKGNFRFPDYHILY